jgi:hypothetical protein
MLTTAIDLIHSLRSLCGRPPERRTGTGTEDSACGRDGSAKAGGKGRIAAIRKKCIGEAGVVEIRGAEEIHDVEDIKGLSNEGWLIHKNTKARRFGGLFLDKV